VPMDFVDLGLAAGANCRVFRRDCRQHRRSGSLSASLRRKTRWQKLYVGTVAYTRDCNRGELILFLKAINS